LVVRGTTARVVATAGRTFRYMKNNEKKVGHNQSMCVLLQFTPLVLSSAVTDTVQKDVD